MREREERRRYAAINDADIVGAGECNGNTSPCSQLHISVCRESIRLRGSSWGMPGLGSWAISTAVSGWHVPCGCWRQSL